MDVTCPICGKPYKIPDGKGRWMVGDKFLEHKDKCTLPREDEFVSIGGRVGVVIEVHVLGRAFPRFTVQFPSGREDVFPAHRVERFGDQDEGRRRFYE
jgi:hypothetical protein